MLEVQFLGGGEDAEVAVWVVGEGLGDALVLLRIDLYHRINKRNIVGENKIALRGTILIAKVCLFALRFLVMLSMNAYK